MIPRRRRHTRAVSLTAALLSAFVTLAASGSAQQTTTTDNSPAPATDAANVYTLHVTVTDEKGKPVEGLKREAFEVFEGGRQLEIKSFDDADVPASVAVVLDASGSMGAGKAGRTRNALLRFFNNCHADDEFFVGVFNHRQQLLVDGSNDAAAILNVLDRYAYSQNRGLSALYDAVYVMLDRIAKGKYPRRAVVLVTDGRDNASQYTYLELSRALRESDVTLYAVGVSDGHGPVNDLNVEGREVLESLTGPTGGRAFFPHGEKELNNAMTSVAGLLRSRYALGVVPAPSTRKDNWHEVKVKVAKARDPKGKLRTLTALTRKGFYWPEKGQE